MRSFTLSCLVLACCGGNNPTIYDAGAGTGIDFAQAQATDAALPNLGDASGDLAKGGTDASSGGSFGPYDSDGSDTVTTYMDTVTASSGSLTVYVYVPSSSGTHPVVVFASGLEQKAAGYAPYGQRLASHGIVAILGDDPGVTTSTTTVTSDYTYLVSTWLPAQSTSGKLSGKIDLTHVGIGGHSRGGQATIAAADALAGKVLAWVGVDPVSTSPTDVATIAMPVLFIGGGTTTSCSPANENYATLYGDAMSPALELVIVNASHTEFEDPSSCTLCSFCTPQGTAVATQVLSESVRYLTAFFAGKLAGDTTVGATLDGAGASLDITAGRITRMSK